MQANSNPQQQHCSWTVEVFKCLWSTLAPPVTQASYKDFWQTTDVPISSLDTDFQAVSAVTKHNFSDLQRISSTFQKQGATLIPSF